MEAGLTASQSKVYLTLAGMGKADGKTLWKSSGIARQDIYRILDELQNKGLIEKILAMPTEFKAVPIEDGLSILLKRKAEEYREVEEKIDELLHRFKTCKKKKAPEEQFILIPAKEAHERRINQAFMNSQKSVDTIMILERAKTVNPKYLPALLKKAIIRGVRARQISNIPEGYKSPTERVVWNKKGSYELRFIHKLPQTALCIIDEKEVFFATDPNSYPFYTSALWTNNPSLVNIAQVYFETLWQATTENNNDNRIITNENQIAQIIHTVA